MDHEAIPVEHWGKDHWSTLAYIETIAVDTPVEVRFDGRMRQKRRHFRILHEETKSRCRGVPMDPKYTTRLKGDRTTERHDDWDCVSDAICAGFLEHGENDGELEPNGVLKFTPLGDQVIEALRRHKKGGGVFHAFDPAEILQKAEHSG